MVVHLFGHERRAGHEPERGVEVRELKLAVQLAIDDRPVGEGREALVDGFRREFLEWHRRSIDDSCGGGGPGL